MQSRANQPRGALLTAFCGTILALPGMVGAQSMV